MKKRQNDILEKSFLQKRQRSKTLVSVQPGLYMFLHANKMKRIVTETKGLLVGKRMSGDNHSVVLLDEELILVPEE